MSVLTGKDEIITCPYVAAHQILLSRLQTHLVKCEKSCKDKGKLVQCPFNSTHRVPELALKCHTNYLCADREKVDTFICRNEEDLTPVVPFKNLIIVSQDSENWDNDDDPTYNPEEHIMNKPIIIHKQNVPPSERKAHRMLERQRFQQFENARPTSSTSSVASKPVTRAVQPSRLPQTVSRSVNTDDEPSIPITKMAGLSVNNDKSDDGFVVPRYAKGRGRGRLCKNI